MFWLLSLLLGSAQAVLPPSSDPFYQPPAGFESQPPGAILRQRPIIAAEFGFIPELVEATQLLYRTRAINGSAIATVTTIFVPFGAATDKFISFQIAEDSSWIDCAPSYNLQLGAQQTNTNDDVDNLLAQAYLLSGYIVSSPDHEGPDAAFAAGRLEGYATLDSMRATRNFLGGNPAIVGAGYSGGAIATGWAASLHPTYAPELPVKAWTFGGTPANLTGTFTYIDKTVFAGFQPDGIDGLNKPSTYQAQLDPVLKSIVTPYGQSVLDLANSNCAGTDLQAFAGKSVQSYDFQSLGPQLLYQPVIAEVTRQNIMGLNASETPTAPVLLYHAVPDEIIPYANASTLYHSWCDFGAKVHFTTYLSGGHITTEVLGLVPAVEFADAAFAGNVPTSCSESTVANPTLNPLALGLDAEPVLVELLNVLVQAGENDSNVPASIVS